MTTYNEDINWPAVVNGFPMPGDMLFNTYRVVASVWGNDDPDDGVVFATGIFMAPTSPYYRVGQVEVSHAGRWMPTGDWRSHYNINHAVADFADSGGNV